MLSVSPAEEVWPQSEEALSNYLRPACSRGQPLAQLLELHSAPWWAPATREPRKPCSSWPAEGLGMRGGALSYLVGTGSVRKLGHARQAWSRLKENNSTSPSLLQYGSPALRCRREE